MKLMNRTLAVSACLALASSAAMYGANDDDQKPDGKGNVPRPGMGLPRLSPNTPVPGNGAGTKSSVPQYGINYHGGPVMTGTKNIYLIWYGNWSGDSAQSILTNLARSIGGSPYFNINTTYKNSAGAKVDNVVHYAAASFDHYSRGNSLSDADIQTIVQTASLPKDPSAVYFVLTSADVNETSGFCTQYCGWHTNGTIAGVDIKYSFVGNPARCPSSCAAQSTSPNNNPGADGMASIMAHELEESATDPDLNAWYDRRGNENGDKCAWTFGTESTASNGSKYNITLGGLQYLIQQNWVNAKSSSGANGYCSMSY